MAMLDLEGWKQLIGHPAEFILQSLARHRHKNTYWSQYRCSCLHECKDKKERSVCFWNAQNSKRAFISFRQTIFYYYIIYYNMSDLCLEVVRRSACGVSSMCEQSSKSKRAQLNKNSPKWLQPIYMHFMHAQFDMHFQIWPNHNYAIKEEPTQRE